MAVAFFDLDGTLTKVDTFIPFCLLALLYRPWRVFALRPLIRACVYFYRGNMLRQDLKETFITAFLSGAEKDDVARWSRIFLRIILPRIVRKEIIEKLQLHQQAGYRVYLVSASPDIYLKPLARQWRLEGAICTTLEWKYGRLTGKILDKNCYGEEKARRIRVLFDKQELEGSFAYGNSDGDRQMLALVSFGLKI